ncbi:hypothetical protein MO973_25095 [Paenibacillus sp. TRM 82003]|nr:hypothetical protein [Paenibacillus sp. TRM 82003]
MGGEEFIEWLKNGYVPEQFHREAVNDMLRDQHKKLIPKSLVPPPEIKKPIKLTKSELNKYMKQMDKDQLMELVKQCYSASKDMWRYR